MIPSVPEVNRRGVFGLFEEPKPEYPARIQSVAQSFAHIRKTLHGVQFLFRKPKTELFNYSMEKIVGFESWLAKGRNGERNMQGTDAALPLLKKKQP